MWALRVSTAWTRATEGVLVPCLGDMRGEEWALAGTEAAAANAASCAARTCGIDGAVGVSRVAAAVGWVLWWEVVAWTGWWIVAAA